MEEKMLIIKLKGFTRMPMYLIRIRGTYSENWFWYSCLELTYHVMDIHSRLEIFHLHWIGLDCSWNESFRSTRCCFLEVGAKVIREDSLICDHDGV